MFSHIFANKCRIRYSDYQIYSNGPKIAFYMEVIQMRIGKLQKAIDLPVVWLWAAIFVYIAMQYGWIST